jgi:hypothetical protein
VTNTILEERTHSDTSLGWGGMQSAPGFKANPVTFEEMQRVHACSLDTPVVVQDWGAIVQTDVDQADETLGSLHTVVEAELAYEGHQGDTFASEVTDDAMHSVELLHLHSVVVPLPGEGSTVRSTLETSTTAGT